MKAQPMLRACLLGGLIVLLVSFPILAEQAYSLEQAARLGLVQLESRGGYVGDRVTLIVTGSDAQDIVIEVRKGDVLLTKDPRDQQLVVTRDVDVSVPAGESVRWEGIYTLCLDMWMGSPRDGDVLDVAPPLRNWSCEEASHILALLDEVDARELWSTQNSQKALWNVTDNLRVSGLIIGGTIYQLLRGAGINHRTRKEFPRLTNPRSTAPGTGFAVPRELLGTGDVQVTLTWDGNADLDLHVTDPTGSNLSWETQHSESGGRLDWGDRCDPVAAGGPENAYWPAGSAPRGEFVVSIDYPAACAGDRPATWTVRLLIDGVESEFTGTLPVGASVEVTRFSR